MAWGDKPRRCITCGERFMTRDNVLCPKCRRKRRALAKKKLAPPGEDCEKLHPGFPHYPRVEPGAYVNERIL